MSEQKEKKKIAKQAKKSVWMLILMLLLMVVVTILLFPYFSQLADEEKRTMIIESIRGKGIWGVLILLGVQILQVVVAFIPGELIEVISGVLYGTFGGYAICTGGMLLGSMLVFYTVRKLGAGFVNALVSQDKIRKFKFLEDTQKLELVVFILFFIPGTPKDMLTYIVPLTPIKPERFFLWATVARIPSVLTSTYAGASLGKGEFLKTVIVFLITGTIGILGIVFHDQIVAKFHKKKEAIKTRITDRRER